MIGSTTEEISVLRPRWHFWANLGWALFCFLNATGATAVWLSWSPESSVWRTLLAAPLATVTMALLYGFGFYLVVSAINGRLKPERLILSADGFTIDTRERRRFVGWADVKQFRVEMRRESMFPVLGWDHPDDASDGAPRWEGSFIEGNLKRGTTHDVQMEPGWALPPAALCDLLETWRRRHAGTV